MTPQELIELVGRMTPGEWTARCRHTSGPTDLVGISTWPTDEFLQCEVDGPRHPNGRGDYFGPDAAGIVALHNHAVPLLQSLTAERDAAQARVKELEAALAQAREAFEKGKMGDLERVLTGVTS